MKTNLHPKFVDAEWAPEAKRILTSCVHCGFCTATCPTYQQLGDERDGPRGRIYLIKQFLEEGVATEKSQRHLDRCLTCRACETTCPFGVQYGRLADIGRHALEQEIERPATARLFRRLLLMILPYRKRLGFLLRIGQFFKPVLPKFLSHQIPRRQRPTAWPQNSHQRQMLVLGGCAQGVATPNTNEATARVLDKLGIRLIEASGSGCCGAASYHLSAHEEGLDFARRNIDAWWPYIEQGTEAVVITASGCGTMVKDYGELLKNDPAFAEKSWKISSLTKDISEVISGEDLSRLKFKATDEKVAIHCPCSLQHGQQLPDAVDNILVGMGINLTKTQDKHLCCGSAGTYSLLQPELSSQLLDNKVKALTIDSPDQIVTANVGCQMYLSSKAQVPVRHWIELVDQVTEDRIGYPTTSAIEQ